MPETTPFTPLEEAIVTAIDYHPLAGARRRPSSLTDTRYEWVLPDDPEPPAVVEVDSDEVDL
jgi:hypothetical protein